MTTSNTNTNTNSRIQLPMMEMGEPKFAYQCRNCQKTWYSVDPYQTPHDPCPRCLAESWIRKPNEDRTTDTDTIQE